MATERYTDVKEGRIQTQDPYFAVEPTGPATRTTSQGKQMAIQNIPETKEVDQGSQPGNSDEQPTEVH